MLTEMAMSSDRMRFKDKIIANIAKAIKGIQEAVFFKNQTTVDDSPLILCNNDRQCHKLCENLDHVFLHGLRQHSHGYWKVVTEYTHKDTVREIRRLRNVTTDLGRGRAWIFMALNDSLLESYIRGITDNTKMLKKHYVKDALLLDQQQMSVLVTLTSGLECAVFQLEYDLPYLDLTAYPPRTRTASEIEEEENNQISSRSVPGSLLPDSETAASTPESVKALTDSDTASMSSLDASALRSSSARVSSVSMDSGFPVDLVSIQSNKQRSVTPIDSLSISSHGSAGEPDRLTRLENMISRTEEVDDIDGGGLEVIRVKGGKKSSGSKKRKSSKGTKRVVSPVSPVTVVEAASHLDKTKECYHDCSSPIQIEKSASAQICSIDGRSPSYGKSPGKTPPYRQSPLSDVEGSNEGGRMERVESIMSRSLGFEAERLTAETKDSFANRFAQLDSTVANIRATTITLHQHQEQQPVVSNQQIDNRPSPSQASLPFHSESSQPEQANTSPQTFPDSKDFSNADTEDNAVACDNDMIDMKTTVPEQNLKVPDDAEDSEENKMSALEELESKCAQLCRPLSTEGYREEDVMDSIQNPMGDSETVSFSLLNQENSEQNFGVTLLTDTFGCETRTRDSTSQISVAEEEEEIDFYSAPNKAGIMTEKTHSYSQLQDYMDYISGHHNDQTVDKVVEKNCDESALVEKEGRERMKDYALRLDNNTKLQIMLDIFSHDDEEFNKMFVTREGHSEGDMKVTFVLVTNHTLYLLKQRDSDRKFETELTIPLKDLHFISISLNKQIINIESSGPNRRKERIWLTPGDHMLAQQILECLEGAIKHIHNPSSLKSHFSIGSDEPLQIIALRKYIARDSHCEEREVEIEDYSLVFWEDTQTDKNKQVSTDREGTMLLRVSDPFKGYMWKPVYVVLRDFMLCLFADKTDSKPQQYVRLGGDQCCGCRLAPDQDRPHCIEIILAKGGSWFLSVVSEKDVSSWLQCLCFAMSEGIQDSKTLSCLPCVSVVTHQKLLLCHEDVQTKFCRTIASAKVEEITALSVDPEVNTYCVVEFESQEIGVSSERWVLYFNSPLEMERFTQSLSKVWNEVYQIPLTAGNIEDLPLQKHCQDQVSLLQRYVSIK